MFYWSRTELLGVCDQLCGSISSAQFIKEKKISTFFCVCLCVPSLQYCILDCAYYFVIHLSSCSHIHDLIYLSTL